MPKAYDVGFTAGASNETQKRGRAYESEKANKDYFAGYAAGLKKLFPDKMIVRCNADSRIFPAIIVDYFDNDKYIECPLCARRYFKEGETYSSDRELTILIK
jgi:hypothetical protein